MKISCHLLKSLPSKLQDSFFIFFYLGVKHRSIYYLLGRGNKLTSQCIFSICTLHCRGEVKLTSSSTYHLGFNQQFSNSLYYQDAFERTQYNDMQSNGRMDSSILSLPSLSFNLYISTTCSYHSSPHPLSLSLSVYLSPPFSFYCSFCSFSHFFLYTFSVNLHLLSLCIRTTKTVRWKQSRKRVLRLYFIFSLNLSDDFL